MVSRDCIKITDSEAKRIKHYFCNFCRDQNPALKIEYKKPKVPSTPVQANKNERPTLASANLNVENSPRPASNTNENGNSTSKSADRKAGRQKKEHSSSTSRSKKSGRRCGICIGCAMEEDCGKCDNCKSNARRRKYDSNAKSSKKCRQRQCINSSRRPRTYSYDSDDYEPEESQVLRETAAVRSLRYSETDSEEDNYERPPRPRKKDKEKSSKRSKHQKSSHGQSHEYEVKFKPKKSRKRRTGEPWEDWSSIGEISVSDGDSEGEQCLGPECVNESRPKSKYCSEECGLKIASARIYHVLPGRIQEWSLTPCAAEEHNKKTLEEVRSKQANTQAILQQLDDKRAALDAHIEHISKLKVDPDNFDDEPDDEGTMYCITCGHEVAIKTCLKHMEKCYNKYESQTSFASSYVTNLGGVPIFCDSYNPATSTYCKRLKVLCPEHTKEPKVRDTAVCGCPLVKNLTGTGEFCQVARKKCNRHFCWEKLRRAEIDMERVRFWMKLDELQEQERCLRQAMTNRAGVMALLLHSTFDHDLRIRIQKQIDAQNRQRERRLSVDQERCFAQQRSAMMRPSVPPPPPTNVNVKPVVEVDMTDLGDVFKVPHHSKREKNRRTEQPEVDPSQQMTASKLLKQMKES